MDVRELMNKAVVSLAEAERLGRVSDVVFDTDPMRVAGVRVAGDDGAYVLPYRISNVGRDAVTVETMDLVGRSADADRLGRLRGLTEMTALKVVDETGTYQGTIGALHVDPASGQVTTIDLETGGVLGLGVKRDSMPVAAIRSVGSDVVTVRSGAMPGHGTASGTRPRTDG